MIADGDIDLAPDFQRHYVWKRQQRWGLIESLLLGIPLPSFYFNENTSGRLQVVDGVQRLTTIFRYVNEKDFKLGDVTYLHDLKDQGFLDLAPMFRRRLNNAQFVAHVIDPQTPYRVKFDIFRRINTGGSPLSAQEIRHCMSGARSRQFLKELATDESFSTATGNALRDHPRMADREVALRFVGFRLFTPDRVRPAWQLRRVPGGRDKATRRPGRPESQQTSCRLRPRHDQLLRGVWRARFPQVAM